jgi:hypothetical protein
MTVNCSEQELDQIWSNFCLEHLFYLLLEHGVKARRTNFYKIFGSITPMHKGYSNFIKAHTSKNLP